MFPELSWRMLLELAPPILLVGALSFAAAVATRSRRAAIAKIRRAFGNIGLNAVYFAFYIAISGPLLAVWLYFASGFFDWIGLSGLTGGFYDGLPVWVMAPLAFAAGDLIVYWRHRIEHTPLFWPVHAIHHCDPEMTWTTFYRAHPLDDLLLKTVDAMILTMLGFPAWIVALNGAVAHYYTIYIHADLDWSYGRLSKLFVSPAMHRWHHVDDEAYANTNYGGVLAIWDVIFGTYYMPGRRAPATGVSGQDAPPNDFAGQMLYPLRMWAKALRGLLRPRGEGKT